MKKKVFFFFLIVFIVPQKGEDDKNLHKKLDEFTDLSIIFYKTLNGGGDFNTGYFYLPHNVSSRYNKIFDLDINFNKVIFFNGFFYFLYKTVELYGENLANNDFGIGVDVGYNRSGISIKNQGYTFQKLRLGISSDINHFMLVVPVWFFSAAVVSSIQYSGCGCHGNIQGMALGIGGILTTLIAPFTGYVPLMINHFLEPFGFYFHSVYGFFWDGLNSETKKNDTLNYDVIGGYYGLKIGWKFIQGQNFSMVLKTGFMSYSTTLVDIFPNNKKGKGNHVAIPLELGILF